MFNRKIVTRDLIKVFFTSDWHFQHKAVMKYNGRFEFMNEQEQLEMSNAKARSPKYYDRNEVKHIDISEESSARMTEGLLNRINKRVPKDGWLFVLGDQGMFKTVEQAAQIFNGIKCDRVFFIEGNHDDKIMIDAVEHCREVHGRKQWMFIGDMAHLEVGESPAWVSLHLSHYPMARWHKSHYGSINLYGHCHSHFESYRPACTKQMDVGVDNCDDYSPISLFDVMTRLKFRDGML